MILLVQKPFQYINNWLSFWPIDADVQPKDEILVFYLIPIQLSLVCPFHDLLSRTPLCPWVLFTSVSCDLLTHPCHMQVFAFHDRLYFEAAAWKWLSMSINTPWLAFNPSDKCEEGEGWVKSVKVAVSSHESAFFHALTKLPLPWCWIRAMLVTRRPNV